MEIQVINRLRNHFLLMLNKGLAIEAYVKSLDYIYLRSKCFNGTR
jgi:hypothetical protein